MSVRFVDGDFNTQNAFKTLGITTQGHAQRISVLEGMVKDLQDAVKTIPDPVIGASGTVQLAGSVSGTQVTLHIGPNGQITKIIPSAT